MDTWTWEEIRARISGVLATWMNIITVRQGPAVGPMAWRGGALGWRRSRFYLSVQCAEWCSETTALEWPVKRQRLKQCWFLPAECPLGFLQGRTGHPCLGTVVLSLQVAFGRFLWSSRESWAWWCFCLVGCYIHMLGFCLFYFIFWEQIVYWSY